MDLERWFTRTPGRVPCPFKGCTSKPWDFDKEISRMVTGITVKKYREAVVLVRLYRIVVEEEEEEKEEEEEEESLVYLYLIT